MGRAPPAAAGAPPAGRARPRTALLARHRRAASLAAVAVVALAGVAFVSAGGPGRVHDAYHRFTSADPVAFAEAPKKRFTRLGNNGRIAYWRVALDDGFAPHPWHGSGAGTYALLWA